MKKQNFIFLVIIFSIFFPFAMQSEIQAAPYYEGKIINIICYGGPGGGHDIVARLLARHLPKYIPGKPTVIIENMPGANGIVAANE